MLQTSDLVPLLAERGVHLSREQVYRMATQAPQRLSTDTLAALCDILGCQPNDLIEVEVVSQQVRKGLRQPDLPPLPPAGPTAGDRPTSLVPAPWSRLTCCPGWTTATSL